MRACSVSEQDSTDVSAMAVSVVARAASGSPSFSIISAISASQARAIAAQLFARTKLGEDGAENFRHLAKRRRHCGRGVGPSFGFPQRPPRFRYSDQQLIWDCGRRRWRTRWVNQIRVLFGSILPPPDAAVS